MKEQLDLFTTQEETFDFEGQKQNLIDNLDMLKEMSVEEQRLQAQKEIANTQLEIAKENKNKYDVKSSDSKKKK